MQDSLQVVLIGQTLLREANHVSDEKIQVRRDTQLHHVGSHTAPTLQLLPWQLQKVPFMATKTLCCGPQFVVFLATPPTAVCSGILADPMMCPLFPVLLTSAPFPPQCTLTQTDATVIL